MKINKQTQLLILLRDERLERYVPAQELSEKLNVSTRQIRKYVSKINEEHNAAIILSSNRGYRMDQDEYARIQESSSKRALETPETRKNYILQKLICIQEGYDIYDMADELFVSSATIETDLKEIRNILGENDLQLKREKNILKVHGSEIKKRSLMSHLISSDSYDNFILKDEVQLLTFHYHYWDFRRNIKDIFSENDIFANDYTLNNTALHLIIMIDRIRNGCIMKDQIDIERVKNTKQHEVSKEIQKFIENTYEVKLNDTELYNLVLIISNHTTIMDYSFITSDNINEYIEQTFIDIAHKVIRSVEKCYFLDTFDEEFITKFTIHVKNMFNRVENDYYAKNPLTAKIKTSYPLIYDIAVFIAQELKRDYNLILNEDEIAFIAFHIGAYFEINVQSKNRVTCAFIYADYYSTHKNTMDKIMRQFDPYINMKYAVSINNYSPTMVHADLIISTVEIPFRCDHVIIHPFLTKDDIFQIQAAIDKLTLRKKNNALKTYLMNFFHKELFYINNDFIDKEQVIIKLSEEAHHHGFVDKDFYKGVLAREQMSSTAFHNVAIPHSLSKDTKQSFISVVLNAKGIAWDSHVVHMVILIGVNDESRKIFSEVFDELVDILSDIGNVYTLSKSTDYSNFINNIIQMMDKNN